VRLTTKSRRTTPTGNGQRATGNGQRATGNGQRATGNGQGCSQHDGGSGFILEMPYRPTDPADRIRPLVRRRPVDDAEPCAGTREIAQFPLVRVELDELFGAPSFGLVNDHVAVAQLGSCPPSIGFHEQFSRVAISTLAGRPRMACSVGRNLRSRLVQLEHLNGRNTAMAAMAAMGRSSSLISGV
jgi:hypothetical protein